MLSAIPFFSLFRSLSLSMCVIYVCVSFEFEAILFSLFFEYIRYSAVSLSLGRRGLDHITERAHILVP
jgi:hypothetical protein